jgi:para-nitrobenzyl esterase
MTRYAVLVVVACATPKPAPVASTTTSPPGPDVVRIDTGFIRGSHGVWKGIPYAAPPVGELRWKPPAPAASWTGIREATGFGYPCVQEGSSNDPAATAMGSEDCLTLNVWAPPHARPLPVMVFIHGGFFTWGSASFRIQGVDMYDGEHLATAANVIVVTLNYRVGPFGFLAHSQLAAEDPHGSSGNYGLLDQIAALRWVQRNIAAFGGDPANVTVFGQSAGAISTAALYASPLARGLFARAIMHSGYGEAIPRRRAEAGGAELARRLGCSDVACMRDKSAVAIANAMPESFGNGYKYGAVVDGWVVPARPLVMVERGEANRVPLVVATTSNEFSTMIQHYVDAPLATDGDYRAAVAKRFGNLAPRLAELYPMSSYASPVAALTAMFNDGSFECGSDWLATAAARYAPTYRFEFDHTYRAPRLARLGAGHGLDLFMVLRNTPDYAALDDTERALSDAMIGYWSRFAHTGDPNGGGAPAWRTSDAGERLTVDTQFHAATGTNERCSTWRTILDSRR